MGAAQGTELLRRLQAASLRAVSSEPQLELRGGTAWKHGLPLPYNAGHLYPRLDGSDIRLARGASDGLALRTRHSSLECHQSRLPESDGGRFIFELLEQLRCESLCSLPGVKTNLRHTFWHWAWQFHGSTLAETDLGQLLWAVCVLAHAKVNGVELPTDIGDRIEATRAAFPPGLGAAISNLRAIRHDQQAYALVAQEIASLVDADISARRAARGRSQPPARSAKDVRGFTLHLDVANEAQHYGKAALSDGGASAADPGNYRIFTTAFDRQIPATQSIRRAQLEKYRQTVDDIAARSGVNQPLLSRQLRALLCQPDVDGRRGGAEQGLLDGSRLAQLVAMPQERRIFLEDQHCSAPYAAVSFLVDCSGSMRHHAPQVAGFLHLLLRALERCDVPTEVLGYTTGNWNGGRALAAWRKQGAEPNPGRLNELAHLVFKTEEQSWRNSRLSLGALLHQPRYKEGIDGEAVRWAAERLGQSHAERRLLIVLSDGSPSDAATGNANGESYLQHDLVNAVWAARSTGLDVGALGVGLDMSNYFGDCSTTLDTGQLATAQGIHEFLQLLQRMLRIR